MQTRPWTAHVITLFPDLFPGPLGGSLIGRAADEGKWRLETVNLRDFAHDRHHSVDDKPAGGGPGMVLRADVVAEAIDQALLEDPDLPLLCMSPRGRRVCQEDVRRWSRGAGLIVVCGRFEGFDERIFQQRPIEEVSLGDFVLAGGEIAAMAMIEASVRLLPDVIGAEESLNEESFEQNLLEYPQFTRPQEWEGLTIPEVLLSGDHRKIEQWRRSEAEKITKKRRPDLWRAYQSALNDSETH